MTDMAFSPENFKLMAVFVSVTRLRQRKLTKLEVVKWPRGALLDPNNLE